MKLLVSVDLSGATEKIVAKARELATALAAEVWLLHVAEPDPDFVGFDVGPQSERDAVARAFHAEHAEIQAIAKDFRAAGLDATALLIQGATAETILREAARLKADMLIVGSHGRGAVRRLLVGSISEAVIRKAECPILVVPTHEQS